LFGAARMMVTEGPVAPYVEAFDTELVLPEEIHEWAGRKARVHLVIGNSRSHEDNPRKISEARMEELKASLVADELMLEAGPSLLIAALTDSTILGAFLATMEWAFGEARHARAAGFRRPV